eukprot:12285303-Alexandrium_andersonii.AAC.1
MCIRDRHLVATPLAGGHLTGPPTAGSGPQAASDRAGARARGAARAEGRIHATCRERRADGHESSHGAA